jgi:hypothetical protein
MTLLFEDLKDDVQLEVSIFSNLVLLKISNSQEVLSIELENEQFLKLSKLFVSWYNEEPGFENLEY